MAITVQMRTQVSQLYVALFGRAPDGEGLGYWVGQLNAGKTMADVANTMYATTPARTYFPSFLTNGEIISSFYVNVLGRTADADGLAFWTAKLNAAGATVGSVINEMITNVATYTGNDAAGLKSAALFNNKVNVAQWYGEQNGNISNSTSILSGVTDLAASVEAAKAGGTGAVTSGQTFTLTNAIDTINGTGGNDTILAGQDNGQAALSAGDNINGGAGTDTLKIYSGAANFGATTVAGVEVIEVHEDAALNVAANADVKEVWSIGGAGKQIDANLTQVIGFANQATGGAATAAFAGAGGTTDAATIALKDAGKTTAYTSITAAGIETLTLKVSGSNQTGTLTATSAAKLIITGDGALTTTLSNNAAYKTIDASAATGKLNIDASAANVANQVLDVKTGSADDSYTTLFAKLTKDDKIDLGGGNDTLVFTDATDLSDATKAAVLGGVTNVEKLAVTGATAFAVNGDVLSQTTFINNGTGAFAGTNFGSGDKLVVGAVDIADSTVAMKLGQNTFNLDLVGTKAAKSDASKITVTGASNVKVDSSGSVEQAAANELTLETDDNGIVTLTGAKDLTATFVNNGATTGLSIDGSAFTGKLAITGTASADIIKGGSGADTFTVFGNGVDEVTGGAGKDKFVVFGTDADTTVGAIAVTDIITDFVSGTDTLGGFGTAGSATNYKEATAVSATLAAFLGDADTALNGTVKYYVGQVGSDTYVAFDDDGTGFTSVVKLTGVALDGIAQADIVA